MTKHTTPKAGRPRLARPTRADLKRLYVRGLLCGNCNHAVGFVKDDLAIVEALGEYLMAAAAITGPGAEAAEA